MTSSADVVDLKGNIFGRTICSPSFVVIATIFSELRGGAGTAPPVPEDQKKPGLNRIKDGASFCYCAYVLRILAYSRFLRNLPTNTTIICAVYEYVEKADLSKGYRNPKRKLAVTTQFFSEITISFPEKGAQLASLFVLTIVWKIKKLSNA